MRLMEIKDSVNIAYSNYAPRWDTSNGNFYIRDVLKTKIAIIELERINFIKDSDNDFLPLIKSAETDNILLTNAQYNAAVTYLGHLKIAIESFHYWINQYIPYDDTKTTISLKMPKMTGVEDLISYVNLIRKSFSPIVSEIGGVLKFKRLEYGSNIIVIDASTIEGLRLIIELVVAVSSCALLYTRYKLDMAKLENIKIDTEIKKANYKEISKLLLKSEIEEAAEKINKKIFKEEKDPERLRRIECSIERLEEFVYAGGEVHLSSLASEEEKKQIPDYESLKIARNKNKIGELPRNDSDVKNNKSEENKEKTDKIDKE